MKDRKIFIDTHVHTIHSELDGMCKFEDYVEYGVKNNFPALFISDHGNISGWVPFYLACKEQNIKPILGSEFYFSEGVYKDITSEVDKEEKLRLENKLNFHLNLYAKNLQGYKNIIKLTTWANLENFYRKPRITFDVLKKYSEGLICTTSCVGSIFAYYINNEDENKAREYILKFKELFKDDFYIEYGYHKFDKEKNYVEKLRRISKDYNIKTIIANDTHYMSKEDELAHKILMCKGEQKLLDKSDFNYTHNYYKSYTEICDIFSEFGGIDIDECMNNTFEIIDKVESFELPLGKYITPELKETNGLSQVDFLKQKVKKGLINRYTDGIPKSVIERTKYELSVIEKMGFAGYFNVVSDYTMWAKQNDIPVGPARGCLVGDTKVLVKNGVKLLKDIKENDEVLTHDNTYKKVTKTHIYDCDEKLLSIKCSASSSFLPTMTSDHKVLCVKNPFKKLLKNGYYKNVSNNLNELSKDKLEWIKANELEKGDYLVRPVSKRFYSSITEIDLTKYIDDKCIIENDVILEHYRANGYSEKRIQNIPKTLKINEDLMYIIGYFIGDGWVSEKKYITFACNKNTDTYALNKIYEYFNSIGVKVNHNKYTSKNVYQVSVYSRIIFRLFKDIIPKYAENKKIPEFILGQNDNLLKHLLIGLIDSDGYRSKTRICYDSINLGLISQIRYLCEMFGYNTDITTRKARIDKRGFNNSESYKLHIYTKKNNTGLFYNDGEYIYCRIKEVLEVENETKKVYDITVEDNHNYSTLDFIVHNSGAGSLINYLIGITEVDPLKHDLIFERFLNPDRLNFPDIDLDFETSQRSTLIKHLTEQYGQKGCVPISTRGYLKGKSSIKVVASKLGLNFEKYNKLLSGIKDPTIDTVQKVVDSSKELTDMYDTDDEFKKVINIAKKIEGSIQSISIHASAVCLETHDISDYIPIIKTKDGYATGWTDKIVEKAGLIKYDILGLSNLSVIKKCCDLIGNGFDIKNIPFDDKKTYEDLQFGDNLGKFQIESNGMKSLLKRLRPENIEHISAILALYRPGSMQFIDEYIKFKNDPDGITYLDNRLEPILKKTYGQIVYQEQVMSIARVLAGYTMAEADSLRKAIGKKIMAEMLKHEEKFIGGCVNNNVDKKVAETLYNQIVEFAKYSFNASHSISYSYITYFTSYLKSNYPIQYMCSLLNCNSDDIDKLNLYLTECYRLGIKIIPPSINYSTNEFVINDKNEIVFGFSSIKGVGKTAINCIMTARKNGKFTSLTNFIERCPKVDKGSLQTLLKVGVFNEIEDRPKKWDKLCEYLNDAKKSKYYLETLKLEESIYRFIGNKEGKKTEQYLALVDKKRNLGGSKKDKELKDKYTQLQEKIIHICCNKIQERYISDSKYTNREKIDNEQELLGFNVSINPYKKWSNLEKYFANSEPKYVKFNELFENGYDYLEEDISTVALLSEIKEIKTKNNDTMAKLTIEHNGLKSCLTIFSNNWSKLKDNVQKGNLIFIVGRLVEPNKKYSSDDYEIKANSVRQLNVLTNEYNKCVIPVKSKEELDIIRNKIYKVANSEQKDFLPIERVILLEIQKGKYSVVCGSQWLNDPNKLTS